MSSAKVQCPHCGVSLSMKDGMPAGQFVKCPKCSQRFALPAAAASAPASSAPIEAAANIANDLGLAPLSPVSGGLPPLAAPAVSTAPPASAAIPPVLGAPGSLNAPPQHAFPAPGFPGQGSVPGNMPQPPAAQAPGVPPVLGNMPPVQMGQPPMQGMLGGPPPGQNYQGMPPAGAYPQMMGYPQGGFPQQGMNMPQGYPQMQGHLPPQGYGMPGMPGQMQMPYGAPPGGKKSEPDLTAIEYLVATIFFPVGFFVGLLFLGKGKALKGVKMLLISGACTVLAVAAVFGVKYMIQPAYNAPTEEQIAQSAASGPGNGLAPEGDPGNGGFQMPLPEFDPNKPDDDEEALTELENEPAEIQNAMRANVRLRTARGYGSGVVIQRTGNYVLIITNRHVIQTSFAESHDPNVPPLSDVPDPRVTFYSGKGRAAKVVWIAPGGIDLALVETEWTDLTVQPMPISFEERVVTGDECFAIGNPFGLGWTYTRGVISAQRKHPFGEHQVPVIQTDTSINPGNSGGGLYSKGGVLLGINTFIIDPEMAQRVGFAIRLSVLKELKPAMLTLPAEATATSGNPPIGNRPVAKPPSGDVPADGPTNDGAAGANGTPSSAATGNAGASDATPGGATPSSATPGTTAPAEGTPAPPTG